MPGGAARTAGGEQEPENKRMRTDKPVSEAPGRAPSEPPPADSVGPASSEPWNATEGWKAVHRERGKQRPKPHDKPELWRPDNMRNLDVMEGMPETLN